MPEIYGKQFNYVAIKTPVKGKKERSKVSDESNMGKYFIRSLLLRLLRKD